MGGNVPDRGSLSQVAVALRVRGLTATPPAPSEGRPPFDHALPNWLWNATPISADVLYTNTSVVPLTAADWTAVDPPTRMEVRRDRSGSKVHTSYATADAYRPERLPAQAPRSEQRAREQRVATAWQHAHALTLALQREGIGPKSTGRRSLALAETALWLAGPATRDPGVPVFADVPLAKTHRFDDRLDSLLPSAKRWGRTGAHILRMECAAAHDLAAAPFRQLSIAQGWSDHEDHAGRPAGASSAKRAVREGRLLLHKLGAWPWAHAERGRLHEHPDWWCEDAFLTPLRGWLARSWARLIVGESVRHRAALDLEGVTDAATPQAAASKAAWTVIELLTAAIVVALDADDAVSDFPLKESAEDDDPEP